MADEFKLSRAFTLAEVLITLGIIGIVASLTIPSLIANYQKTQYVVGLKKAYSQVNQALLAMTNDYGTPGDLAGTGLFASGANTETFCKEFVKYIRVSKDCGVSTNGKCWADKTFNYYDGTHLDSYANYNTQPSTYYKFDSADGMSFNITTYAANGGGAVDCKTNWSSGATGNLSQVCGQLNVDVNGLKGPNCLGRDTFFFYLSNGKGAVLYPAGGVDGGNPYNCDTNNSLGTTCSGKIIEQGWEMNY